MTTFYRFPSNQNLPAEYVREGGIGVSVIGDWYDTPEDAEPVYIGYLVNTTEPVAEWAEYEVQPAQPMRIFG